MAEIDSLEAGAHRPPPAPHTRATPRDGRPGAPLWQLCDFRADVLAAERAGIEAALEASGLLDAWLLPEGVLVDPTTEDTILATEPRTAPEPPSGAPTLDRWLEPVPAEESLAGASADVVRRVLAAIGADIGAGEHWVASNGSWRLGPLQGRWSKPDAEHIGEASRAAARRRRVAALRTEQARLEADRDAVHAQRRELDARADAIAAEFAAAPSSAPVREARFALAHAADGVATAFDRTRRGGGDSGQGTCDPRRRTPAA